MTPPIDQPRPEIPIDIPARTKPEAAMVQCPAFPVFPDNLHLLVSKVQAEITVDRFHAAAEAYALCNESHRTLSEWIRSGK